MQYMPSLYSQTKAGYTEMSHEDGWILVFVIFGLERILLVAGLLIYFTVPAVPEDVQDELERRQFLRMQAMDEKVKNQKKTD